MTRSAICWRKAASPPAPPAIGSITSISRIGRSPCSSPAPAACFSSTATGSNSPQLATGPQQGVDWKGACQPFGQIRLLVDAVSQNLRFPGQYADAETGYYHNGFRDYDPTLGRYVESDPIGLAGGLNTYAYAMNNPLKFIDPVGDCPTYKWKDGTVRSYPEPAGTGAQPHPPDPTPPPKAPNDNPVSSFFKSLFNGAFGSLNK